MSQRLRPDLRPRLATPRDLSLVEEALRALARDLDDPFRASPHEVARALFGPEAFAEALIAAEGARPAGVCLFWPVLSTATGGAGVHVSDLWTAPSARGAGLGRRLLAAAAARARARWGARFARLSVYADNPRAEALYRRLGFERELRAAPMALSGAAFAALAREGEA
ncbi:GNAT family N-acetyltransferase [Oceanicella actignis]|uniref:Acetyltransferase (GNAT) family protein n=1 Tax=Oceanicella actignis TaxID=1189325 RepID=A0A1M7SBC4_9RHOB|nr:GNAT family N-acetyltransferase [Oceanicella actignis]SET27802.1 Acetyltransferase (GNAT) family protein [Oceanicella actignis]SHN55755.1 Acetyltransferase (GNAT) family protein [Oceanicella actignis]